MTSPGSPEISTALEGLQAGIEDALINSTESFYQQVSLPPAASAWAPTLQSVRGGKHFRALCGAIGAACAISMQADGDSDPAALITKAAGDPRIMPLMTALELYQASALVHDDLLDDADTRRGSPSPHIHFAALHSKEGLWGNAEDFGRDGAVLVGDFLMSAAHYALSDALEHSAPSTAPQLLRRFALMTGEVAMGQWADTSVSYLPLDHAEPEDTASSVSHALAIVRRKSARYSVMYPAILGATAANGSPALMEILERVLEPAGIAFQLRDDALGAFGEPNETGKPTGSDIAEGKRTVLLALTLGLAPNNKRERINALYHRGSLNADEINEVHAILREHGNDPHEELIAGYVREALDALAAAPLPAPAKMLLSYLVDMVTSRTK